MMLPLAQALRSLIFGREHNELQNIWKEWVVANLTWPHSISREILRKTTKATVSVIGVSDEIRNGLQPNKPEILKC
jgi:hypothetical protein